MCPVSLLPYVTPNAGASTIATYRTTSSRTYCISWSKGGGPGDRTKDTPAQSYTSYMADEDTVLEEAMDNLKEAGQRIRATQSLMRSEGMTDGETYLEARRRRDL